MQVEVSKETAGVEEAESSQLPDDEEIGVVEAIVDNATDTDVVDPVIRVT